MLIESVPERPEDFGGRTKAAPTIPAEMIAD
jgi:hypothetical protein